MNDFFKGLAAHIPYEQRNYFSHLLTGWRTLAKSLWRTELFAVEVVIIGTVNRGKSLAKSTNNRLRSADQPLNGCLRV